MAIGELDLLVYGQRCVHAFTTADQHDVDMNVRKSNTGDTNVGGEWTGCYTPVSWDVVSEGASVHPHSRGGMRVCVRACVNDWPACLFI